MIEYKKQILTDLSYCMFLYNDKKKIKSALAANTKQITSSRYTIQLHACFASFCKFLGEIFGHSICV